MLEKNTFDGDVLKIAPKLLGSFLYRKDGHISKCFTITEVEAYDGEKDLACHASRGMTERNSVMYGPPGIWYVYLVYGMHNMLNIVTGKESYPSAILIRGTKEVKGPGRLTRSLSVDRSFNGKKAIKENGLWLGRGIDVPKREIKRSERIGVEYAGEWAKAPYRFLWEPKEDL